HRSAAPSPAPRQKLERERRPDRKSHLELVEQRPPASRAAQKARVRPLVDRKAQEERIYDGTNETHVVKEREPRDSRVTIAELPVLADSSEVRQHRRLRDDDTLRVSSRPRRRLDEGDWALGPSWEGETMVTIDSEHRD